MSMGGSLNDTHNTIIHNILYIKANIGLFVKRYSLRSHPAKSHSVLDFNIKPHSHSVRFLGKMWSKVE